MAAKDEGLVFVNGGSRGIGAAIVRAFRAAGRPVAFTWLSSEEAAVALASETGAMPLRADSGQAEQIDEAVRRAEAAYGAVSVLVNCAAISFIRLYGDVTAEEWEKMRRVNLEGPMQYIRAVLPGMIHKKAGRIINITSMWGQVGASCEVHYSVTKAALIGLTKALAKEVAPSGITVNAVAPGVIETGMNSALTAADRTALCEEIPLCRFGTPEEVADAVLFLAGGSASYITGQVLSPNGGMVM